jgi:hypothetical protein
MRRREMKDNGLSSVLLGTDNKVSRYNVDSLESLQKAVGGYIEMLRPHKAIDEGLLKSDIILIVDEEGILKNKAVNLIASALFGSILVGDVVITKEKGTEAVNLKENELKAVEKLCGRINYHMGAFRV